MRKEQIRVLRKKPGEGWRWILVDNTLEALQKEVGGYIETVTIPGQEGIVFICNEEGRLMGLPENGFADFVGTILAATSDDDEFDSLGFYQAEGLRRLTLLMGGGE